MSRLGHLGQPRDCLAGEPVVDSPACIVSLAALRPQINVPGHRRECDGRCQ